MKLFRNLKKYLPTPNEVQEYRYIHIFGDTLKQPELWALNRGSTSKGVAIGLFCAFLPMPFETLAAIFLAITLRANIPLAFACVWISNPVTWVPLYTPCYTLGSKILRIEPIPIENITILELGWHYVALWLGCLMVGTCVAFFTHFLINFLWRSEVKQKWNTRKKRRLHARAHHKDQGN